MKLFIVGNGFDRGHNLNTSYWDFRVYLEDFYPGFLYEFEQHYDLYPSMDEQVKKKFLWNEFETNLANIDEDIIIENAVSVDLGLESGDVGIEDTLYEYFTQEYGYIELLSKYLKQWVRTIRIRDVKPRTSLINKLDDSLFITFNYTAVLETVYGIGEENIIHIHGSLRQRDEEPIIGHGNQDRINDIQEKLEEAEREFDEKEMSICRVVKDYYRNTYKDVNRYMYKLSNLKNKNISEIQVIGHSIAEVDVPYFRNIDILLGQKAHWIVYYYDHNEKGRIYTRLKKCGVTTKRIEMRPSTEFYNL